MDLVGIVNKATKLFFDVNTISVDNWTFKMYYKATIVLVALGSVMTSARQFFGSPIQCDAGAVSIIVNTFLGTYTNYVDKHVGGRG